MGSGRTLGRECQPEQQNPALLPLPSQVTFAAGISSVPLVYPGSGLVCRLPWWSRLPTEASR